MHEFIVSEVPKAGSKLNNIVFVCNKLQYCCKNNFYYKEASSKVRLKKTAQASGFTCVSIAIYALLMYALLSECTKVSTV